MIVSYVEMLADLPWNNSTEDNTDLARAQAILDRDHYGLEKVKRRIVEFLAVRKLNPGGRSPILCFLGPPELARRVWVSRSPTRWAENLRASPLEGFATKLKSGGTVELISERCPGRIIQEIRRTRIPQPGDDAG